MVVLIALGRSWWCLCGGWAVASWDIWSRHNSQHLFDPYTLSHISHGLLFFVFFAWVLKSRAVGVRFVLATGLEVLWEIAENSPFIIERYRSATISLDYYGDSILNSLSDTLSCGFGFWLAARIGVRLALVIFVALDLGQLLWVRDCLSLNILMLINPLESVKSWQRGAG